MKTKGIFLSLITLLTVFAFIGCDNAAGPSTPGVDTTAPTVVSTVPASAATGVSINSNISAVFSEAMDEATVVAANFTVFKGAVSVSGAVSYDLTTMTATFDPTVSLDTSSVYTATLTTTVADVEGNTLAANHVWTFTTAPVVDTLAPTVLSTSPVSGATGVSLNSAISAIFIEEMDQSTIVAANFTLLNGDVTVNGTVSYDANTRTARFAPTVALATDTLYTAALTTAVADTSGNFMDATKTWTFTTAAAVDTTAPTVLSTIPAAGATSVSRNGAISAKFSEDMDQETIVAANFTVVDDSATPLSVAGVVSYDATNSTAKFDPTAILDYDTLYTATLTTAVADLSGNLVAADYVWTFRTTAELDETAPTVLSTIPSNLATGVDINGTISAKFSEAMDHATIVAANFTLKNGDIPVLGNVSYDIPNMTARFAPTENLVNDTVYTATVTIAATDISGNPLATNKVWTFTTAVDGLGPEPVILGSAGNFVILAKTAISTVPASAITGDIGVSPAAETFLTGFSQTKFTGYSTAPQVTGFMYAADMTPPTPTMMTTAISDMELAYTDAAGRSDEVIMNLGAGEIGGLTLEPGLYKWGTSVSISTDLVIDGAENDVWIFQVDNNMSIANGKIITLSGGAQAKNIFWQVAGATSLGTTSQFKGVILCKTAVTVKTGASLDGKILAQTAVALDQATITDIQ